MSIDLPARQSLYALLIAISTAIMLARVASVESSDPRSPTPFLSANDRSRWATIRALGDDGTYAIDHIIFNQRGNRARGWHTIDLVRHRGPDGREHYYSSKPTLFTTLLAGEYWLIKTLTGATLVEQPFYVARLMLVLTNVLPLTLALMVLTGLIERFGATDWTKLFAVTAACFATFMTPFAVTLNNHVTAAISLIVALAVSVPILAGDNKAWWRFAAAGLALGFLAANELPALSLLVLAGLGLLWISPLRTLLAFLPAVLLVAAGAFGTNYWAHADWRTPYAHRQHGPLVGFISGNISDILVDEGQLTDELQWSLQKSGLLESEAAPIVLSDATEIELVQPKRLWKLWDPHTSTELALIVQNSGSPADETLEIRRWGNWYEYKGSYWLRENLRGIDRGESSQLVYAFNVLIGHHGLFSLTPIWLLSAAGCAVWLLSRPRGAGIGPMPGARMLAVTTILITIVVVGFYLSRPQLDRNYGGGTCCLRWLIWLTPLWLLTMLPAADWISRRRWARGLAIALLAMSVFSSFYAADNPWSHPWIFDYWTAMGWIDYGG
jgi:hypothetical protein